MLINPDAELLSLDDEIPGYTHVEKCCYNCKWFSHHYEECTRFKFPSPNKWSPEFHEVVAPQACCNAFEEEE